MKKITTTISAIFLCIGLNAQKIDRQADVEINFYPSNVEKYEVKVINSPNITKKISAKYQQQAEALASENRGAFFSGLLSITETAAFGVLGQSTSTLASATFSTITSAIKNKKQNWQNAVKKESSFEKKLLMIENIDDFYTTISDAGALDPCGMAFNGLSCLQKRGQDTVLFISCSLDTSDISVARILKHSKFELKLDTLTFNPTLCNLPNDSSRTFAERKPYSFDDRGNISLSIKIEFSSSWINQAIQIHKDVKLGEFTSNISISKNTLEQDGIFRFIRGKNLKSENCSITGDCFIIPRSYIGVRDTHGIYHDAWGTGQYKVAITLKELCGVSQEFAKNWKDDWKDRPKQSTIKQDLSNTIKQTWSKNSNTWICSFTQAPMTYTKQQVMSALGINTQNTTIQQQGQQNQQQNQDKKMPDMK